MKMFQLAFLHFVNVDSICSAENIAGINSQMAQVWYALSIDE